MERLQRRRLLGRGSGGETLVSQIILRTVVIVLLMAALLGAFIWIAAEKADELSIDRQRHVVATVIEQSARAVAHDQEASTVWDDAVEQLRRPVPDPAWLDHNLGIWFHTYYGSDEILIVDAAGRPVYAMRGGRREDPAAYARSVGATFAPLIAELRRTIAGGVKLAEASRIRSPETLDLGTVHGHPAIISVKPVVYETAGRTLPPGTEHLHVAVRYLDGSFVADLKSRYQLDGARFQREPTRDPALSQVPLRSRNGHLIGYFVWQPFAPGAAMLRQVAPVFIGSMLVAFALIAWLLHQISRRTWQLGAAKSHAQHLADHDPLTSLANRALFDKRLVEQLDRLGPADRTLALLYVDLDHFKNVNDHLGHPTGDLLICALSRILSELAPGDVVARLGGDEFAIIHSSADQAALSAEQLAHNIHRALACPIDLGDGEVLIGASIGIAVAPRDGNDAVELVRKADIALYEAKRAGRGRSIFFDETMGAKVRDRSEIEADLCDAMRNHEGLDLVYQPIFSADGGDLIGAEALVRWNHPRRGRMMPDQFIPIAEESGLIEPLNEWVLEQACSVAARWPAGILSVNLSGVQLRNPALAERVYAILHRTRLDPARLELEITETSLIDANDDCRRNLGWLRDIGVHIALDDFGTGYSSFRHLGFEVDRIKIDQSFVAAIQEGQAGSPVIQAIADLARLSGLKTTAEGVETEQQKRFLTSIGCDSLQGFLLCEPLEREDFEGRFFATAPARPKGGRGPFG
jgi:diguanylate cyclase (GGDEF)-like protein